MDKPSAAEKPLLIDQLRDESSFEAASRHSGQAVDEHEQALQVARHLSSKGMLHAFTNLDEVAKIIELAYCPSSDDLEQISFCSGQAVDKQGEWTVEHLDELLDLKFELGPVDLKVSEYIEKLRLLAFKINSALTAERQRADKNWEDKKVVMHAYAVSQENDRLKKQLLSALAAIKQIMVMDSPDYGRKLIAGEVHDVASKALSLCSKH